MRVLDHHVMASGLTSVSIQPNYRGYIRPEPIGMSVAVLQRHQTGSMGCWRAFLRSWGEDLTNIVRKHAAAVAW